MQNEVQLYSPFFFWRTCFLITRTPHKTGEKRDFSEIGYNFLQQRKYKYSTWAIKNSAGAKNSPWIMSFYFRRWARSPAVCVMWMGRSAAVPVPWGSSSPWCPLPRIGAPSPASARPPLPAAPHSSSGGSPRGLFFGGLWEKRPWMIVSSPEV